MEPIESARYTKQFGRYLREIRERRRLSLDAVETMSATFQERLTKSHLSRIENGQAEPNFRKLYALSQIYGMPLTLLAERFEVDLQREQLPSEVLRRSAEERMALGRDLMRRGRYGEAQVVYRSLLEEALAASEEGAAQDRSWILTCRLNLVDCLIHLGRYETAKIEVEEMLSDEAMPPEQRCTALYQFTVACYRLRRFSIARMGAEQAQQLLEQPEVSDRLRAAHHAVSGNLYFVLRNFEKARLYFDNAANGFQAAGDTHEACRARINLGTSLMELDRGDEARAALDAALSTAEAEGYDRLRALALNSLAILAFREGDHAAAENLAIRSNTLARALEYHAVVFANCYYLWRIAQKRGDTAMENANERTLRSLLSRVEDVLPEVEAFRAVVTGGAS